MNYLFVMNNKNNQKIEYYQIDYFNFKLLMQNH